MNLMVFSEERKTGLKPATLIFKKKNRTFSLKEQELFKI